MILASGPSSMHRLLRVREKAFNSEEPTEPVTAGDSILTVTATPLPHPVADARVHAEINNSRRTGPDLDRFNRFVRTRPVPLYLPDWTGSSHWNAGPTRARGPSPNARTGFARLAARIAPRARRAAGLANRRSPARFSARTGRASGPAPTKWPDIDGDISGRNRTVGARSGFLILSGPVFRGLLVSNRFLLLSQLEYFLPPPRAGRRRSRDSGGDGGRVGFGHRIRLHL